jgi:hypothetical protein
LWVSGAEPTEGFGEKGRELNLREEADEETHECAISKIIF